MRRQLLTEETLAVVIAVGRTHHGVHMVAAWHVRAVEGDGVLVVELDQDHRGVGDGSKP